MPEAPTPPPKPQPAATPGFSLVAYPVRSEELGSLPVPRELYTAFQTLLNLLMTTRQRQGAIDLRRDRRAGSKVIDRLKRAYWGDAAYAPEIARGPSDRRGPAFDDIESLLANVGPAEDESARILRHAHGIFSRLPGMEIPTVIKTDTETRIYFPPQVYYKKMIQAFARDKAIILMDSLDPWDRIEADVLVDRFIIQMAINQCEVAIRTGVSGSALAKPVQTLRNALARIGESSDEDPEVGQAYRTRTMIRLLPYRCAAHADLPPLHLFEDSLEECEELVSQLLSGDDAVLMFFSAVNQPIEIALEGINFAIPAVRPVLNAIAQLRDQNVAARNEAVYDRLMRIHLPAVLTFMDLHKMVEAMRARAGDGSAARPWARAFDGIDRRYHPLYAILKTNVSNIRTVVLRALRQAEEQGALLEKEIPKG